MLNRVCIVSTEPLNGEMKGTADFENDLMLHLSAAHKPRGQQRFA